MGRRASLGSPPYQKKFLQLVNQKTSESSEQVRRQRRMLGFRRANSLERLGEKTLEKAKSCTAVTTTGSGRASLSMVAVANSIVEQEDQWNQAEQGMWREDRDTSWAHPLIPGGGE